MFRTYGLNTEIGIIAHTIIYTILGKNFQKLQNQFIYLTSIAATQNIISNIAQYSPRSKFNSVFTYCRH